MAKKILIIICILACSLKPLSARCTKYCFIKYETSAGWSQYYYVQVHFMTGYELNTATRSYYYSGFSRYAVVFWGQNQCSIIKISTTLLVGMEFECDVLTFGLSELEGRDQDGDKWKICAYDNMIETRKMFKY